MPDFIPGLKLSELFYHEVVQPILATNFPALQYSAALIGTGSEVLGFDDAMSCDHDWGPRLMLFLHEADAQALHAPIQEALSRKLPQQFRSYPTAFPTPDSPGSTSHRVVTLTFRDYLPPDFKFDVNGGIRPADWLILPQHWLREITSGAVYYDGIGLQSERDRFAYYPYDVWLYLLMASWTRIGQEQHLMGRAGFTGDELGATIIGSRLAREVMRLCFLMEKQYAPYPKWFGTAFTRLESGKALTPVLMRAQLAATWQERATQLGTALEYLGAMHGALSITAALTPQLAPFFGRPFRVLNTGDLVAALRSQIRDSEVGRIADQWAKLGNIDHISDSPDFVMGFGGSSKLRDFYQAALLT